MKIKFLVDKYYGNTPGDVVEVEKETEFEYCYYDGFGWWCYIDRHKEGIEFEVVEE